VDSQRILTGVGMLKHIHPVEFMLITGLSTFFASLIVQGVFSLVSWIFS
jgi:hypothetical protein